MAFLVFLVPPHARSHRFLRTVNDKADQRPVVPTLSIFSPLSHSFSPLTRATSTWKLRSLKVRPSRTEAFSSGLIFALTEFFGPCLFCPLPPPSSSFLAVVPPPLLPRRRPTAFFLTITRFHRSLGRRWPGRAIFHVSHRPCSPHFFCI